MSTLMPFLGGIRAGTLQEERAHGKRPRLDCGRCDQFDSTMACEAVMACHVLCDAWNEFCRFVHLNVFARAPSGPCAVISP